MTTLDSIRLTHCPKIKSWLEVLKEIIKTIENQNERCSSITIPYGLQLENDLWNPEELRVAIHVTSSSAGDCFLSHHGVGKNNKLNVWTITTTKDTNVTKTGLKTFPTLFKFQYVIFVTKRWIYISYCIDMTIHVFSAKFVPISSVFAGRTILCLEYNKRRDEVLAGIAGGIMIWNFPVKQTDQLIPGRIINCTFCPDEWPISLKVDSLWDQIIVISKEKIAVLETKNYKCLISFTKNTEVLLASCVLYNPMNYFIVGDQSGLIRVMSSSLASLPQVTQFLGHCDAITSLVIHLRDPLLISGSRDKTIRIWNFDTFAQTFCLQTGEEILHVDLINSSKLYYRSNHSIKVWHMNLFHTLFATLSSKIIRIMRVESPGYPARILVHAIDGGIRLISPVTGCQLTSMLPITTLSSSIVDVCHDRQRELLYVVLGNREVLVFESDSNPCCASQLWQAEYTDEGVCSIALLNAEYALGEEDLELESGLLFAGHYNGQISLLDGHGVQMKNIQAHQGQIIRLCSSHGHNVPNDTLEARDHLVSLGKDSVIRVWIVRHVVQMTIRIELKCEIRLMSIPSDLAMIGNTLCMVMNDFRVYMARVKVKSKGIFTKDKPCDFLLHSKDESHTAAINGLSSCPHLKLFATSSEDQSIRLWNIKNQLVRELNFDETLCGVSFANHRGDLLVGFQCHISLVTLTNYLPGTYLDRVSSMHFENDPVERYVQFDDHLQFWYEPKLVPTLPMDLLQRRPLIPPVETPQPWEEESESGSEEFLIPDVEDDGLSWLRTASQRVTMSSRASIASRISVMSRGDQEEGRLSSALFGSKASSMLDAQGKDLYDLESVLSLIRTSQLEAELSKTNIKDLIRSRAEQKALFLPPQYWPCAPDCFIPNSVIRKYIKVRRPPAHMIPRLIRPVKEKKIKKKKERKKSADTMESTRKALRRKIPSRKIRSVPKPRPKPGELPSKKLKKPESMPRSSMSSPAAARAELRRRRRSLIASQPDAIFEEMSEGEEEQEEEGKKDEEPEVVPAIEEKLESVVFEPEPYIIDYGERDEDYRSYSSTSEEEEEEEEEEEVDEVEEKTEDEEIKEGKEKEEEEEEEKEEIKAIEKKEDLEIKPKVQYPFVPGKPAPESVLHQIVRKPWYPKKRKAKAEVNEVVDNVMKVLTKGDLDVFDDVCTDVVRIKRAYGISTSNTSLLHDMLLKYTWHEDPNVRRKGIETLRHLNVKKKDTTLAMISRIVDEDEDVREEAKSALRDLHEIYTMEDLTGTLMKLGVVSFQLPCNDNMVLSELMDRLRQIKEVKRIHEEKKQRKREAKEEREKQKRKYRLPVSKRRESHFAARRRSIKPLPTETSPSDVEEFRHELNETYLGCRLLQQLSPVSNILYTHFVGSLPSLSTLSSPGRIDLAIAGKSVKKTPPPEGLMLSSTDLLAEKFRQAAMAGSPSSMLPRLGVSSSTVVTAAAARRHSRTLEAMLCGTEALRRHSLLRRTSDVTSGVAEPLIANRKGKMKRRGKERVKVTVETEELESEEYEEDEEDETRMSLDGFVEVMNEMKTSHVGRTLLLSLMHIKGDQPSKKRISFDIGDILNLISQLPAVLKQEKPVFDTVVNLLQGAGDQQPNDEKLTVKIKQSLLIQLFQIRDSLSNKDEQTVEVNRLMANYRAELNSEWTAEDKSETCAVRVMDLMWILSMISNKEDRKFFIKNIIINTLKELRHVKITSQRPLAFGSGHPAVEKLEEVMYTAEQEKKSGRFAEDLLPTLTATAQRDKQIRDKKLYKNIYKAKEVNSVRHRISALRTPVRRSLVPGVQGERLAHSLDVNRPLPYKEIERLITQQIVRSLPYRLSFHTGASEWGRSKYGILEVTWTSRGPTYTISDVDIHGRAFKRDVTKYVSPEHLSRDNLRQSKDGMRKVKECSGKLHGEKRSCANSHVEVLQDNKKTLPPVLRNRLQKNPYYIPMPGLAELGQESSQQTENSQRLEESTFCISDSYPTAPSNSPRLSSPYFTLPSLQTKNQTIPPSRRSLTRDTFTSQVDDVFMVKRIQ